MDSLRERCRKRLTKPFVQWLILVAFGSGGGAAIVELATEHTVNVTEAIGLSMTILIGGVVFKLLADS